MRALAMLLLVMASAVSPQAKAQSQGIFNAGAHHGRLKALARRCSDLQLNTPKRNLLETFRKIDPSSFAAGVAQGSAEVDKILEAQSEPDAACALAILLYGPSGLNVTGMARINPIIEKKREQDRKRADQAVRNRRDVAAPNDAADGDLIITGDPKDRMGGRHALRIETDTLDGRTMQVGCVPCFNMYTNIAIIDGVPFAANGLTMTRRGRFRVVVDGVARPVRGNDEIADMPPSLISRIQTVPGCAGPTDIISRGYDALTRGICLAD